MMLTASVLVGGLALADILIVAGPDEHPPNTHEAARGARYLARAFRTLTNASGITTAALEGWPSDAQLGAAKTIVFLGDLFPPSRMHDSAAKMAALQRHVDRGVGIVCIHYATGVRGEDTKDGDHPLLRWVGGYFANPGSKHHESVARIFPEAWIEPAAEHPVNRGWTRFRIQDEPYIKNYFGPNGNRPGPGVTVFATSTLPPESPAKEAVAWGIERSDGGRGFAVVMPHFYRNWADLNLRTLILNGIGWTAKAEIPAGGLHALPPEDIEG